jgi:hypothetical protein
MHLILYDFVHNFKFIEHYFRRFLKSLLKDTFYKIFASNFRNQIFKFNLKAIRHTKYR